MYLTESFVMKETTENLFLNSFNLDFFVLLDNVTLNLRFKGVVRLGVLSIFTVVGSGIFPV